MEEGPCGLGFLSATLSPLPSSSSHVSLPVEVIPHITLHFSTSKENQSDYNKLG